MKKIELAALVAAALWIAVALSAYTIPTDEAVQFGSDGGVLSDFHTGVLNDVDPPSIGGRETADVAVYPFPILERYDQQWAVFVSPQSDPLESGVFIASARCSADSTLVIRFGNFNSAAKDPDTLSVTFAVFR